MWSIVPFFFLKALFIDFRCFLKITAPTRLLVSSAVYFFNRYYFNIKKGFSGMTICFQTTFSIR